jgi:hypothetical protein
MTQPPHPLSDDRVGVGSHLGESQGQRRSTRTGAAGPAPARIKQDWYVYNVQKWTLSRIHLVATVAPWEA